MEKKEAKPNSSTSSNVTISDKNENANAQISKVSLKLKSERANVAHHTSEHRNSLTLTSIIQLTDGIQQINSREVDVNYEGPCSSNGITAQITVLYSKNTFSDETIANSELKHSKGDLQKDVTNISDDKIVFKSLKTDLIESKKKFGNANEYEIIHIEGDLDDDDDIDPGDVTKETPPPYTPTFVNHVAVPQNLTIFEPAEFQISITPPTCPPTPRVLHCAPPLHGAPPTYSAIMRIGPVDSQPRWYFRAFGRRTDMTIQPSPPFIAPAPPPSYAETQGLCLNQARPNPASAGVSRFIDLEDTIWGADPTSVICPHCTNFVITTVHTHRSNLTHFSALALCMCGCWPCCLLPYCLRACKTTYHECPMCLTIIGMYNPW